LDYTIPKVPVTVPSSELAPHAQTSASKCVTPPLEPRGGGQHPPVGEGVGGPFRRLERKPDTLYTLWEKPFVISENPFMCVIPTRKRIWGLSCEGDR
jgi:hypothetical protein